MAKEIPVVLLNDLQLATVKDLKRKSNDGVIAGDIVVNYKQNVIGALMRHGVLKLFRGKHYKLTDVNIQRKPDHTPRKPKVAPIEVSNDLPADMPVPDNTTVEQNIAA